MKSVVTKKNDSVICRIYCTENEEGREVREVQQEYSDKRNCVPGWF